MIWFENPTSCRTRKYSQLVPNYFLMAQNLHYNICGPLKYITVNFFGKFSFDHRQMFFFCFFQILHMFTSSLRKILPILIISSLAHKKTALNVCNTLFAGRERIEHTHFFLYHRKKIIPCVYCNDEIA